MKLKITAVIVFYNRPEKLRLVVHALLNQLTPIEKIIVIDNNSKISAADVLSDLDKSVVKVNRLDHNLGGAGGFSIGINNCKNDDWLWLMDDDAVPCLDASEKLLHATKKNPGVKIFSQAVFEFGELALNHNRSFNPLLAKEKNIDKQSYLDASVEVDVASFVGFFVNKEVVKNIGLPNPDFFISYDDVEYSLRARRFGYKILLIPASKINHLVQQGSLLVQTEFSWKHYYNIRNRIVVMRDYCAIPLLGVLVSSLIGLKLFLRTKNFYKFNNIKKFVRAVRDGITKRLGLI